MIQNLRDAAKAVLRGKFIAIQSYFKKQEKSQINNLTLHLEELEKEQTKPKVSRGKEIIKIRAEINEIEIKKTDHKDQSRKIIKIIKIRAEINKIETKINKSKSWLFEKINKTDKPLARLIKKKREGTQINKIRNEKGEVTTDTAETESIIQRLLKATLCQ